MIGKGYVAWPRSRLWPFRHIHVVHFKLLATTKTESAIAVVASGTRFGLTHVEIILRYDTSSTKAPLNEVASAAIRVILNVRAIQFRSRSEEHTSELQS